jgi:hypothetical protein
VGTNEKRNYSQRHASTKLTKSDTYNTLIAVVAQWIEYWPPKPRVVGSIPASRTINASIKNITQCNATSGRAYLKERSSEVMTASYAYESGFELT